MASWLVRSSQDRAVKVRALAGEIVLCSWARHLTLTVLYLSRWSGELFQIFSGGNLRWTIFLVVLTGISSGLMGLLTMQTKPNAPVNNTKIVCFLIYGHNQQCLLLTRKASCPLQLKKALSSKITLTWFVNLWNNQSVPDQHGRVQTPSWHQHTVVTCPPNICHVRGVTFVLSATYPSMLQKSTI